MTQALKKVMVLGAIGVGKTSLSNRLVSNKFETNYKATIGVDLYTADLTGEGHDHGDTRLVLWDTDGDFGMSIFSTIYMRGAAAAILVADATRPSSIDKMRQLLIGFRESAPGRPCSVFINKVDLIDPGARPDLMGTENDADSVCWTSAKTGENVTESFHALARAIERRGL